MAAGLAVQVAQSQPPAATEEPAAVQGWSANGAAEPAGETIRLMRGQSKVIMAPWPVIRISVTDPDVADVKTLSPRQLMLVGKNVGTTDLLMWNQQEQVQRATIHVMADLEVIQEELRRLFPDATLELTPSRNAVILTGSLARPEQVMQLRSYMQTQKLEYVDMTQVAGVHQVQIQVRVAEVSRQAIRALGINAFYTNEDFFGASVIGSDNGGPLNPISIGAPEAAPVSADLPFQILEDTSPSSSITLFAGIPELDLQVFLQALAENQFLRILAEPNLTALSGEKASFLAGGEFPIPVVQSSAVGSSSITVEYKEFGVRLLFQPVVLGDNRIRMYIAPEVSELSDVGAVTIEGFRIPSLVTRRASTTLEMYSGQTFAMAGLIQRTTSARASRIPGIGDIPILGALFRSVRYSAGETELVVLVSASVVEPVSAMATSIPLPGETHQSPDDWELYGLGRLEGKSPARVSPEQAEWLEQAGLTRLRGPGAWASYDSKPVPVRSSLSTAVDQPAAATEAPPASVEVAPVPDAAAPAEVPLDTMTPPDAGASPAPAAPPADGQGAPAGGTDATTGTDVPADAAPAADVPVSAEATGAAIAEPAGPVPVPDAVQKDSAGDGNP